jgi:DNA polymerase III delta subunit
MEKTWKIINTKRLQENETVIEVIFSLTIDNGSVSHQSKGSVKLERDENSPEFIPYKDLTENTLIQWVQQVLGEEGIASIEERILRVLPAIEQKQNQPAIETGLPWK